MADKTAAQAPEDAQPPEAAPASAAAPAPAPAAEAAATKSGATTTDANPSEAESAPAVDAEKKDEEAKNADGDKPTEEPSTAAATTTAPADEEKPTSTDVEMTDKPAEDVAEPATDKKAEAAKPADEPADAAADSAVASGSADADAGGDKSKARRKSSAVPEHLKGSKKLSKKASKAKILHLDAKPGDHFFAKLKGFPPWPVIICEEDMLPQNMLSTRPVTAARPDGTYREDFADGGKRAADRTYPVMYLHTNEFGWTVNTDLSELDASTVADLITPKMRKDLQAAHLLAAEHNNLDYYKNVLREFEEQRLANLEAKAAKARTPKKKAAEPAVDEDGDLEMVEAGEEDESVETSKKKKTKKRKADEDQSTPQRSESVKKPKIKLTSNATPKNANGTQSPNPAKESTSKSSKSKAKQSKAAKEAKDAEAKQAEAEAAAAAAAYKEPELTAEERKMRKEKEILFLRHRLQKGLLIRDQEHKEEEMQPMSEFLAKLETFPDLEVAIIRVTKINKVLKAILKLESIPKEDEFKFKPRSQSLLDKWNKILSTDGAPASAQATTNGVNGTPGEGAKKDKEATNGVKETTTKAKSDSPKDVQKETAPEQTKEETAKAASAGDSETEDKPAAEDAKPATLDAPTEVGSAA